MAEKDDMNWISGFWRRIGALFVDSIILGVVGLGLGLALEKQFVELGGWGRFIGFFIALIYFGVFNSKLSGGQTFCKKVFKLKVVNADNQTIGILRSFARYSILGIPFFLNGAHFTNKAMTSYWLYPLSFIIFGGLSSVTYLYIFNRATRQSLHDLIVGTFVVNANVKRQEAGAVWRPHLIVVGALFVIAAAVPVFTSNLAQSEPFRELLSAQTALMKIPSISYATVTNGYSSFSSVKEGTKTTTYVNIQALLKQNTVTDVELARHLAEILTSNFPESLQKDVIQINLTYGYDIGIASQWRNHSHTFNPKELTRSK
jgi:uncharacterized RDD family membrane protein YckC